jgi:hypothetical protein
MPNISVLTGKELQEAMEEANAEQKKALTEGLPESQEKVVPLKPTVPQESIDFGDPSMWMDTGIFTEDNIDEALNNIECE